MIQGSSLWSTAAPADPIVCPYLGLVDDPRTHFAFATTAHRCHSGSRPERIEVTHQATLCLSVAYPACQRYVAPTTAAPTTAAPGLVVLPSPAEAPIAHASSRVRWRSGSDGRRSSVIPAVLILAGALTLAIVAAGVLGLGGFLRAGPSHVSGSSPTVGLASPTASPQPTPTTSVPPTSGPTPRPSGSARALPTTHIVARGESLTSIARHYGVTLAALEKANGIKNPSLIVVGQKLIIPAP